jgi:transposase
MVLVDEKSKPLAILVTSASTHEVRLVKDVLKERVSSKKPRRLTGDKAYDSDTLDRQLARGGVELNAPHRRGRRNPPTQDGRKLRGYRRRWKVERFFAWLFGFRKCVTRYEYHPLNFAAFLMLASAIILMR